MKRYYLAFCRRWGPEGITLSAWAWKRFLLTGDTWLRDRIDGASLFWGFGANHCQASYQRWRARNKGLIE